MAASLLARLGRGTGTQDDATELAAFFEFQTKGLFRRSRMLVSRPIKTPAQNARREALFNQVDFAGFAHALALAADEMVPLWSFGSDQAADNGFALLAERSAPTPIIDQFWDRLMSEATIDLSIIVALRPRLDQVRLERFARQSLAKGSGFGTLLAIAGAGADIDGLVESPAGKALLGAATGDGATPVEMHALGLIASQPAARAAIDRFVQAGIAASDPLLDLLRLNAALNKNGVSA